MSLKPTRSARPRAHLPRRQGRLSLGHSAPVLRDELGRLYADQDFAALFPTRGQPALAPAQLALVTLMQFAENLTDRQAAEAVRAADRLEVRAVPGAGRPGLRLLGAVRVPRPAAGRRGRSACSSSGCWRAAGRPGWCGRADGSAPTRPPSWRRSARSTGWSWSARRCEHALHTLAAVAPDWLRQGARPSGRSATPSSGRSPPARRRARGAAPARLARTGSRCSTAPSGPPTPEDLRRLPRVEVLRRVWECHFARDGTLPPGGVRFFPAKEELDRLDHARDDDHRRGPRGGPARPRSTPLGEGPGPQ